MPGPSALYGLSPVLCGDAQLTEFAAVAGPLLDTQDSITLLSCNNGLLYMYNNLMTDSW